MFFENYNSLMNKIKDRNRKSQCSWIERINIVKMSAL